MVKMNRNRKMQEVRDIIVDDLPDICKEAIALVRDDKLAASARAQLISTLFRAAGLFEADNDASDKEPYEMTPAELAAAVAEAKEHAADLRRKRDEGRSSRDVDGIMG